MVTNKLAILLALSFFFVVPFLGQVTFVQAEPQYDRFGGLIGRGAEKYQGHIDLLSNSASGTKIIIDDTEYRLGTESRLYTIYGNRVSIKAFKVGMPVVFYAVKGQITNMWPDNSGNEKKNASDNDQQPTPPSIRHHEIYREGNTWKN